MQKNVAISAVSPSGNSALADRILGAVIEPAKTRWLPGALLSSAFAAVVPGTVSILSPLSLVVLSFPSGVDAEDFCSTLGSVNPVPANRSLQLRALPGTSRSRVLDFLDGAGSVSGGALNPSVALAQSVEPLAASLLLPVRPSFTATTLAGKIDSYFQDRETPVPFLLAIDQINGTLSVWDLDEMGDPISSLSSAEIAAGAGAMNGSVLVAYDLSIPSPEDPVDGVAGPVWG